MIPTAVWRKANLCARYQIRMEQQRLRSSRWGLSHLKRHYSTKRGHKWPMQRAANCLARRSRRTFTRWLSCPGSMSKAHAEHKKHFSDTRGGSDTSGLLAESEPSWMKSPQQVIAKEQAELNIKCPSNESIDDFCVPFFLQQSRFRPVVFRALAPPRKSTAKPKQPAGRASGLLSYTHFRPLLNSLGSGKVTPSVLCMQKARMMLQVFTLVQARLRVFQTWGWLFLGIGIQWGTPSFLWVIPCPETQICCFCACCLYTWSPVDSNWWMERSKAKCWRQGNWFHKLLRFIKGHHVLSGPLRHGHYNTCQPWSQLTWFILWCSRGRGRSNILSWWFLFFIVPNRTFVNTSKIHKWCWNVHLQSLGCLVLMPMVWA